MPRKKASGPLTQEQLGEIAQQTTINSLQLLDDAHDLLEAGAVARAYALTLLAAEEFGKAQLAVGAIARDTTDSAYWKAWWSTFYGHGPKLVRAAVFASPYVPPQLMSAFTELFDRALKEQRREVGFYVDLVDGAPVRPDEAITREEAEAALDIVGSLVEMYWSALEGDVAGNFMARQEDAVVMRAAIESRDPQRIRDAWERTNGEPLSEERLVGIMQMLGDEG